MNIQYFDHKTAERLVASDNAAMISISDPNYPEARFAGEWKNLIRLKFDDLCPEELVSIGRTDLLKSAKLFTTSQAKELLNFIQNLPDNVNTIYVHCHKGRSRSVAVAKFLGEKFATPVDISSKNPNPHVYKLLKVLSATIN